jgi:hypothetical protein
MKTSAYQSPHHRPRFHRRLEPIWEGLAEGRKIPLCCSPPPPKIRRIGCEIGALGYVGLRLINMRALPRTATF